MDQAKESWWKHTKNHLIITRLAGKFGWIVGSMDDDIKQIADGKVKENLNSRLEDLQTKDKMFNGDDGSSENLKLYENLLKELVALEQDVKNALKS